MRTLLLTSLLVSFSVPTDAAIYRYVDDDGNVVFTDRPRKDAQTVTAEVENTYSQTQGPAAAAGTRGPYASGRRSSDEAPETEPFSYQSISIVSPADDESLRDNAGNVSITATTVPPLRATDVAVLLVDGAPAVSSQSLQFNLENVDRGTHTLAVRIQSSTGQIIGESPASTFHLQRYSRLNRPN